MGDPDSIESRTAHYAELKDRIAVPDLDERSEDACSEEATEDAPLLAKSKEEKWNWFDWLGGLFVKEKVYPPRTIYLGAYTEPKVDTFQPNMLKNSKYTWWNFVPLCLAEQFKFFLNIYFLLVTLTQFYPPLQVGYLFTYLAPLVFVLGIALVKEGYDDIQRHKRDTAENGQLFPRIERGPDGQVHRVDVPSQSIVVGDIITITKDQRVPADCVLLRTTERSGACFIRTDQLDGETDWKLRRAVAATQILDDEALLSHYAVVHCTKPNKHIYKFMGRVVNFSKDTNETVTEPLGLENTLWASTVVASGTATALVVNTGLETRSAMNMSKARSKIGLMDYEINTYVKILFGYMVCLSFLEVAIPGFQGQWWLNFFRFILLFSAIIPISMRVNLDLAKTVYQIQVQTDKNIPGAVVRTSTIPEQLGRISYVLSDKTGTLTCNEMSFKRLHIGARERDYTADSLETLRSDLAAAYADADKQRALLSTHPDSAQSTQSSPYTHPYRQREAEREREGASPDPARASVSSMTRGRSGRTKTRGRGRGRARGLAQMSVLASATEEEEDPKQQLYATIRAIALCHNVTPVVTVEGGDTGAQAPNGELWRLPNASVDYQGSSPDEMALVRFADSVHCRLRQRELKSMVLEGPLGMSETFDILAMFPFSSATKRMAIVVRSHTSRSIEVLCKGADNIIAAMSTGGADWLKEQVDSMAREGLRTLVFARKSMDEAQYQEWNQEYQVAKASMGNRAVLVRQAENNLLRAMSVIGVSGVEDRLQPQVQRTLEDFKNAGIRTWMLTGDKVETAKCIARSTCLVQDGQDVFFQIVTKNEDIAFTRLHQLRQHSDKCLVVDGNTLTLLL
ncbi:P-type ATPase, subfamily IV, partial [Kipferlia bialata]|eukprot:g8360.t1